MIEEKNGLFSISSGRMSYIFRPTEHGQLMHLHFGVRVRPEDASALTPREGAGWGCSVLYEEDRPSSCLDTLPLEWSGSGRGDYRESPAELETENGPVGTDFVYAGYEIADGTAPMACALPQADGASQTLSVRLEDRALHAELTLYYSQFGDVVTRRARLTNRGGQPLFVRRLMSACLDMRGDFDMVTFNGGWIAEARKNSAPVGGARVVNESTAGFSSNRANPGFMLAERGASEDAGRVYGFNLVYSGNHYASAQASFQGLTRVMQGVSPANFRWRLGAGESFETPETVMAFSDRGFGGLSETMHGFVNGHIVPPAWRYRPRPVLYNDWEGCMFDFTQRRLAALAGKAKKLGCELFVLDDGWFGARDSDRSGLGDYSVNENKLPDGLGTLAEKIKAAGMDFGLWFEPEAVNPDSELYRAHPDWALTEPGREPLLSRHELLLDLTKPEVRDYIVSSVSGILDGADISYVKWDMNRPSCTDGNRAHEYILGLYDVLGRIFRPRRDVLLESCASGGNRFDLGMLCFSPQIWCSDDTDPIERLSIQNSLSYLYPQSCMGAHISASPHAQTLRRTPLSTRCGVSFFGVLGVEMDLAQLKPVEERELRAQIKFYKAHRETFQFGTFRRLAAGNDETGWQTAGEGETIAGFFSRLVPAAPGYETRRLKNLDPGKVYRVETISVRLRVGDFGGLVKYVSPVRVAPDGLLARTADRLYSLPDGGVSFAASGAALMAGFAPAPRFTGTGYDKNARNQGDFGSELYIVSEEKNHDKHR